MDKFTESVNEENSIDGIVNIFKNIKNIIEDFMRKNDILIVDNYLKSIELHTTNVDVKIPVTLGDDTFNDLYNCVNKLKKVINDLPLYIISTSEIFTNLKLVENDKTLEESESILLTFRFDYEKISKTKEFSNIKNNLMNVKKFNL